MVCLDFQLHATQLVLVALRLLLPTPATILSAFLVTSSAFLPLPTLCVLIPGFRHQPLGPRFGFFPLSGDLWQSSRNVWAPPQDRGWGTPVRSPCGGPHCTSQAPCTSSPPRDLLPPPGMPPPPPPSARRLDKVVKVTGPSPPSSAPRRIARVPSPDGVLRPPEAEACSSSSLGRDAHQGPGRSPLSLEPGATHVSESAALGQREPLYYGQRVAPRTISSTTAGETRTGRGVARRSREARAGPRRLVADAGARRASRPARALEEGERARGRPGGGHPGKQGPRGGAGGGTAVPPLPRKPSRSHARARTHVHTVGSEDTSGSP